MTAAIIGSVLKMIGVGGVISAGEIIGTEESWSEIFLGCRFLLLLD